MKQEQEWLPQLYYDEEAFAGGGEITIEWGFAILLCFDTKGPNIPYDENEEHDFQEDIDELIDI